MPANKILYGSDYPLRITHEQPGADFLPFLDQLGALDLDTETRAAIMGLNAQALMDVEPSSTPTPLADAISEGADDSRRLADRLELPIDPFASVATIARRYPRTVAVFERFGIPAVDNAVPVWEPIVQSAAARGVGSARQAELIEELNRVIGA